MAKVISDYTLEIGWSGKKVLRGVIELERRLAKLDKTQQRSDRARTTGSRVASSEDKFRSALLDKTERKLNQLRLAQTRLNKEGKGYKIVNRFIQGNINSVQRLQDKVRSTSKITKIEAMSMGRSWKKLGHEIDATKIKMAASGGARGAAAGPGGLIGLLSSGKGTAMGMLAFATFEAGRAALTTANAYENLDVALLASFGDIEKAAKELEFIKEVADKFKVSTVAAGNAWAMMALSARQNNMPMSDARGIFEDTTIAISGFGLSTEDAKGAFRALNQIMSKGQVTMDDFKNELAQRMPGAMGTLQKSLGVTSDRLTEMFEKGEIGAESMIGWSKAMKKMVVESGALEKRLQGIPANMQAFTTSLEEAAVVFFGGESQKVIVDILHTFTSAMKSITPHLASAGKWMRRIWDSTLLIFDLFSGGLKSAVAVVGGLLRSMFGKKGASEFKRFIEDVLLYWNDLVIEFYLLSDFINSMSFDEMVTHFSNAIDDMKKKLKELIFGTGAEDDNLLQKTLSGGAMVIGDIQKGEFGSNLATVGKMMADDAATALQAIPSSSFDSKDIREARAAKNKAARTGVVPASFFDKPTIVEVEIINSTDTEFEVSHTTNTTTERNAPAGK